MGMKNKPSLLPVFLRERKVKRNLGIVIRFALLILALIVIYTVLFHVIMGHEKRSYSFITGLYWALTTMTTLGFGDITFQSDIGKLFTVLVLFSGVISLLVMLPFVFVQLIFTPWIEEQKKIQTPRAVAEGVKGHIIMVGITPISLNVANALGKYGFHCVLLAQDSQTTLDLQDQGYNAVMGDYDDSEVYRHLRLQDAAMLVAMDDDIRNTNVVFTAREISAVLPVIARAERDESIDILVMAGASKVYQFRKLLGRALAHRVITSRSRVSVLNRFGPLVISEAPLMRTPFIGQTLAQSALRHKAGINVVGVWEKGVFSLPTADMVFSEKTVMVVAGTEEQMEGFENELGHLTEDNCIGPVVVLGGGRVGYEAARELTARGIEAVVVDKAIPGGIKHGVRVIHGDASDLAVLEEAGIRRAPSVIITTHDDDINIYLTIYCRSLRPDVQIISRASLDRNVSILHSAGANLVLSLASMITNSLINSLSPGQVFLLNEGLSLFRATVGDKLKDKTLHSSGIRAKTQCSVVAVYNGQNQMRINPGPDCVLAWGDKLFLIGDSTAENSFYVNFGGNFGSEAAQSSQADLNIFSGGAGEYSPERESPTLQAGDSR